MAAASAATLDPSPRREGSVRAAASPAAETEAAEATGAINNSSTRVPPEGPSEELAIEVVAIALAVLGLEDDDRGPDVDGAAAGLPNRSPLCEGSVGAPAASVPTAPKPGRFLPLPSAA